MKLMIALAVGYWVGSSSGRRDLDQLTGSLKALCGTDEFADVVSAARAQVGAALRDLADAVEPREGGPGEGGDLVARVRHLVGRP